MNVSVNGSIDGWTVSASESNRQFARLSLSFVSLFSFACPLLLDLIHDPSSSSQTTPLLPAIEDVLRPFLCSALVRVAGDSIARRKTGVIAFEDDEKRMKEEETGLLILPSIDVRAKATILGLAKRLSLW